MMNQAVFPLRFDQIQDTHTSSTSMSWLLEVIPALAGLREALEQGQRVRHRTVTGTAIETEASAKVGFHESQKLFTPTTELNGSFRTG